MTKFKNQIMTTMFKPSETHNIVQDNGVFHLVACCFNSQELVRERGRKWLDVAWMNRCLIREHFCLSPIDRISFP